ncbi:RAB19 [Mytilus coruscus]|uniref:RAB19 n=1 Tax=Mytilus coruscus TaxID=42192 RepID=A0A6J8EY33_MYTCO|nr:RAB19 [Mytilus coruscus]
MGDSYDYLFKIILVGDNDVGKTSFVRRFTTGHFQRDCKATLGVDFTVQTIQLDGKIVKPSPLDTCITVNTMMLNMRDTRRGHQRSLTDKGQTGHVGQNHKINNNKQLNCGIFCVCETCLVGNNKFDIEGYTVYGHNRLVTHLKAKRGSGGVGIFIKSSIGDQYKVKILDKSVEGILWLNYDNEQETFCVCVCYLPPRGSSRSNDPEQFYANLINQVYMYQNIGHMYIVGDFNLRCSDISDFIEGVDDVTPREVIDYNSNANGDLLIDFLVDCNLCMLNGRKGKQDFRCISKPGKSVVDFIITTHENIHMCTNFDVRIMSDITN